MWAYGLTELVCNLHTNRDHPWVNSCQLRYTHPHLRYRQCGIGSETIACFGLRNRGLQVGIPRPCLLCALPPGSRLTASLTLLSGPHHRHDARLERLRQVWPGVDDAAQAGVIRPPEGVWRIRCAGFCAALIGNGFFSRCLCGVFESSPGHFANADKRHRQMKRRIRHDAFAKHVEPQGVGELASCLGHARSGRR